MDLPQGPLAVSGELAGESALAAYLGGEHCRASVVHDGRELVVFADGARRRLTLVDPLADVGELEETGGSVAAPMPGKIAQVLVKDGTEVKRDVSECHIALPQGDGHTPVILGEPGDEPLLGAVTLEILGLILDPFKRTLRQMRGMLASICPGR